MKNYTPCFTIMAASCLLVLLCVACNDNDVIDDYDSLIPDPVVRHTLAEHLGKAHNDEITSNELATVTGMFIWGKASDLTGLQYCVNLTWLYVDFFAYISDLNPLSNLTNLQRLYLRLQEITDISPLSRLTNLTTLDLVAGNQINDITPLTGLTNLTTLLLDDNLSSDLQPLVSNAGLGLGDIVSVVNNPLSAGSRDVHIPALLRRGVKVGW